MSISNNNMRPKRNQLKQRLIAVMFLLPSFFFIIYAVYIPFFWNAGLSFTEWNGFSKAKWVGLENYEQALKDTTSRISIGNSVFIGIAATVGAVVLGVFLAALVYKVYRREGAFYRLIMFMPVMLPSAIVGLLFVFIFNPAIGMLNGFLRLVGLGDVARAWLEDKNTVLWCIIFVNVWRMSGLSMMLSFAAMQMLPTSIFESSKLDGASYPRQFFSIILPLIRPTVLLCAIYTLSVNFKAYDIVSIMTGGGPGTTSYIVPINMVKTAFNFGEFGYAAAQGVILTAIVIFIIGIIRAIFKGETYEY